MVDIHLVSWNRPRMTELVIRTIHRNTNRDSFRLVVVDNGSAPETLEMLFAMQNQGLIDELHPMSTNIGLEKARQFLLYHCTYPETEYFVCVDNDCLPPPKDELGRDWVDGMVELMEKYENYAAISQRTQVMIGTGNIFEHADEDGSDIVDFPHPGGSLRIMRAAAVREVGGWADERPGRGAEERYIGAKLHEAGYKTAFAVKIQCLHLFGLRGPKNLTDRWGYDAALTPEETGHSDIWHPALQNGDDKQEVLKYAAPDDTEKYYA